MTISKTNVQQKKKFKEIGTFLLLLITGISVSFGALMFSLAESTREGLLTKLNEQETALKAQASESLRLEKQRSRVELRTALERQKQELTKQILFKPKLALSDEQNSLCLAIMLFGEERMGSEMDMVLIAQTVINRAMDSRWGNNACAVASEGQTTLQYSSMGPYIKDISDIVWGRINDFTPYLAKRNVDDMLAWKRIRIITERIMDGLYPKLTEANHFVALSELKSIPGWLRNIRPVGNTSGHVLLVDFEFLSDGTYKRYTKASPYNQAKFNKNSWVDFDKEFLNGNNE